MKKFLFTAALALVTAGCSMESPETPAQMRDMSQTNFQIATTTYSVPRSFSAVNYSLKQGASKCFNTVTSQSIPSRMGNMIIETTLTRKYWSQSRVSGSTGEHAVYADFVGGRPAISPENPVNIILIDTKAISGGTSVTTYLPSQMSEEANSAVSSWARGGALRCPALP